MTTTRQLKDQLLEAIRDVQALDEWIGKRTAETFDLAGIAATLESALRLTAATGSISGVPKIELPLEEWLEIERMTGYEPEPDRDDGTFEGRKRARGVIRHLELSGGVLSEIRQKLAHLTGGGGDDRPRRR